jgi:hypothetical protein
VNFKPRPPYPEERSQDTDCIGGCAKELVCMMFSWEKLSPLLGFELQSLGHTAPSYSHCTINKIRGFSP